MGEWFLDVNAFVMMKGFFPVNVFLDDYKSEIREEPKDHAKIEP